MAKRLLSQKDGDAAKPLLCLSFCEQNKPKLPDTPIHFPIDLETASQGAVYGVVASVFGEIDFGNVFESVLGVLAAVGFKPQQPCSAGGLKSKSKEDHENLCLVIEFAVSSKSFSVESLMGDLKRVPRSFFVLKEHPSLLDEAVALWLSKFPCLFALPEVRRENLQQVAAKGMHIAGVLSREFPKRVPKEEIVIKEEMSAEEIAKNWGMCQPVMDEVGAFVLKQSGVPEQLFLVFIADVFHATRSAVKKFVKLDTPPVIVLLPPPATQRPITAPVTVESRAHNAAANLDRKQAAQPQKKSVASGGSGKRTVTPRGGSGESTKMGRATRVSSEANITVARHQSSKEEDEIKKIFAPAPTNGSSEQAMASKGQGKQSEQPKKGSSAKQQNSQPKKGLSDQPHESYPEERKKVVKKGGQAQHQESDSEEDQKVSSQKQQLQSGHGKKGVQGQHQESDSEEEHKTASEKQQKSKAEHGKAALSGQHQESDSEEEHKTASEKQQQLQSGHGKKGVQGQRQESDSEEEQKAASKRQQKSKAEHGKAALHGQNQESDSEEDQKVSSEKQQKLQPGHGKKGVQGQGQESDSEEDQKVSSEKQQKSKAEHGKAALDGQESESEGEKMVSSEQRRVSQSEHSKKAVSEKQQKSDQSKQGSSHDLQSEQRKPSSVETQPEQSQKATAEQPRGISLDQYEKAADGQPQKAKKAVKVLKGKSSAADEQKVEGLLKAFLARRAGIGSEDSVQKAAPAVARALQRKRKPTDAQKLLRDIEETTQSEADRKVVTEICLSFLFEVAGVDDADPSLRELAQSVAEDPDVKAQIDEPGNESHVRFANVRARAVKQDRHPKAAEDQWNPNAMPDPEVLMELEKRYGTSIGDEFHAKKVNDATKIVPNLKTIAIALKFNSLPGPANDDTRESVMRLLEKGFFDCRIVILMARRTQRFKGLYVVASHGGIARKIWGQGPNEIDAGFIDSYSKYDTSTKLFVPLQIREFTQTTDGFCLKKQYEGSGW